MPGIAFFHSPVGWLRLCANDDAITNLDFVTANQLQSTAFSFSPLLAEAKLQLEAYFAGRLREFSLPLAPAGTPFQRRVWDALTCIPYGQTRSYGQIAAELGKPGAMRAVGGANNKNPISILIPCHRVIGATGKLVGYGGGLAIKQWLLVHEGCL